MLDDLYSEPRPVQHQDITGGRLKTVRTNKAAAPITGQYATPTKLDPSVSWSFFHPGRCDVRFAPREFADQLHALDRNLEVVWHPIHERWCVWVRNAHVRHWMCPGWQLLFPVKQSNGEFCPLDARVLAEIVNRSPRKWGNGRQYFDRVIGEINRDRKMKKRTHENVVGAIARERYDFAQIKTSMCGPSNGSKFSTHHSGN